MRVLMTLDAVGGVWSYAATLARGLAARGDAVLLAGMGPPPSPARRAELAALETVELVWRPYALEWTADPWKDVDRAGAWLLELARRFRPEVVHLGGYAHAALPFGVPTSVFAHSCVASWWRAVKREPAPARWDAYRRAVRRGLDAADLVCAPTAAMLAALEREHGPVRRGVVIRHGLPSRPRPALEKLPFVLAAGRLWDEAKNLSVLEIVAERVRWPVLAAGDGSPDGRHHGDESASPGHLRRLGPLESATLRALMDRAAIFAHPARYEPFGLAPLEAAQSGCALVLGDVPSLRELWNGAAVLVAPDDARALAAAIERLARDPLLRSRLGARARSRAGGFELERMIAATRSAFLELTATRAVHVSS